MTRASAASTRYPASASLYPDAASAFRAIGWTTNQWDALHTFFTGNESPPGGAAVADWLRHPPLRFVTPINPSMVRDLHARHGKQTAQVLAGIAVGASERFCVAFLNPRRPSTDTVAGWLYAADLDLTEPEAVGWAGTGYLHSRVYQPDTHGRETDVAAHVTEWTDRFGPDAYLYVLAGITLDEAIALQTAGTTPTAGQLRVMAALNGHTLPPGV